MVTTIVVFQLFVILIYLKKHNLKPNNPLLVLFLFYVLFYLVPPFMLSNGYIEAHPSTLSYIRHFDSTLLDSVIYSTIYLLFILIGLGIYKYDLKYVTYFNNSKFYPNLSSKKLGVFILIMNLIITYYIFQLSTGNLRAFIISLRTGSLEGSEFISLFCHSISFTSGFFLGFYKSHLKINKILITLAFILSLMNLTLIGDRSGVLYSVGLFLIFYFNINGVKVNFLKISTLLIIFFLLLSSITNFREELIYENSQSNPYHEKSNIEKVYSSFNLISYEYFMITLERDITWPYNTFLNNFIGFVPRFLWSDKPSISTGLILSERLYYDSIPRGRPFTTLGEWIFNFGLFGIILGGFLYGKVVKYIFKKLRSPYSSAVSLYSVLITIILVIGNGIHSTVILQYAKFLIPTIFLVKILNKVK